MALHICPLCEATCGLVVDIEDGAITRARGDDEHVLSKGYICPKGANLPALDQDPDRLDAPLIRDGDGFRTATWNEAFAEVDRLLTPVLAEHGRDAVALYLGNPNVHTLSGQLYVRVLMRSIASRAVFTASTVDQMPKHRACAEMFGDPLAIPVPDIDRAELLLIVGGDPLMSNGSLWTAPGLPRRLRALRKRGGRLIVVDPRRSRTAGIADQHLAIRPGRDALLLAALATTLFDEDLVDVGDHLAPHVTGLAEAREALAPYTAERVASACGIEAAAIRALARELAGADRAAVYGRMGTTTTAHGTVTSWLVDVLNVLTGNLDRPGGAMFPQAPHEDRSGRPPTRFGRWTSRVSGHPELLGELPSGVLAEEIDTPGEGQLRGLICIAGNPVLSVPGSARLDAALSRLDVMISIDPYVTATSRHAHVILPPERLRHRAHCDLAFAGFAVRNAIAYTPASVPLPAGRPAEWQIVLRLAAIAQGAGPAADLDALDDFAAAAYAGQLAARATARTGGRTADELLGAVSPRRGPERLLDLLLRSGPYGDEFGDQAGGLSLALLEDNPHGVDLGALQPRVPEVVLHDSLRLAPEALLADLPRIDALLDDGDGTLLVGRRHLRTNNSWMHNLADLAGSEPLCTLQVHPDDAASWGVVDGGAAKVLGRDGALVATVEVTPDVRPGVVSLPHGFGFDGDGGADGQNIGEVGANVNILTGPPDLDPLSGTAALTAIPVEVVPA